MRLTDLEEKHSVCNLDLGHCTTVERGSTVSDTTEIGGERPSTESTSPVFQAESRIGEAYAERRFDITALSFSVNGIECE